MFTEVFFPHLTTEELEIITEQTVLEDNGVDLAQVAKEEAYVVTPVDDVMGHRQNPMTRIFDPSTSPLEKEKLMATMNRQPSSKSHELSDQDLINMAPSRHNQTLTDIDKYADAIGQHVDAVMASEQPTDPAPSDGDTSE